MNAVPTLANATIEPRVHRKLWTREEAAKLTEMFAGQRYELIEGELIDKMGQKPPHAYTITLLTEMLTAAFPGRVRIQLSIALPDPEGTRSEPEPDVVVLHTKSDEFSRRHPGPSDIALLIEVSDTTFPMDREIKARLYSRSGIEEYWIVDIQQRRIMVFRNPGPEEYKSVQIYEAHEEVAASSSSFKLSTGSLFV